MACLIWYAKKFWLFDTLVSSKEEDKTVAFNIGHFDITIFCGSSFFPIKGE
jgi:hypothetical protein